ncbi:iron-containing alcohol dehydrogenase [Methyloparacoccus murrellii]
MQPFSIGRLPRIEFGPGRLVALPDIARAFGHRLLIVTGGQSFVSSPSWEALQHALQAGDLEWELLRITGEPAPEAVDEAVRIWGPAGIDAVIGIGGGSVLDAAKAIAGLLKPGNSVMQHLEGVGPERPYRGPATPFVAVPTTAGTGSEATRNAVLTRQGADGFKKSFRDDRLVATHAIVDPDLLAGCPPELIAANGMDAFTQLLEAYVSLRANPLTDALAESGLRAAIEGLLPWYEAGPEAAEARARMAYAALLSGICLAQTGLGSVHGLAQPLGSLFPIPHGVVCGTLLAAATAVNLTALQARAPVSPALARYADVGRWLVGRPGLDAPAARAALLETLSEWTVRLRLPRLAHFGVGEPDLPRIVANARGASMKTNPVELDDTEIATIVRERL